MTKSESKRLGGKNNEQDKIYRVFVTGIFHLHQFIHRFNFFISSISGDPCNDYFLENHLESSWTVW